MKYYRRNGAPRVEYTKAGFQPCWTCKKACGGCSWSQNFKPIAGWTAEKTFIESNGDFAESYKIISCPEYINDRR